MRVLVLKDRRPGEYRKALGLAAIVARMANADVKAIDAWPRRFARNRVRLWAIRRSAGDPGRLLRALYGIDPSGLVRPNIVIGAGRPTAAAGILMARLCGAKFLYAGYLRDYDPADIDAMLVATPRQALEPRCVLAPIPCLIDPDAFGAPRRLRSAADLRGAHFSLFLGGSRSGYRFSDGEWREIGALITDIAARLGVRWRVANSRRTPEIASSIFADLLKREIIDSFVDVRAADARAADSLFGADAIMVTEDSLTMIAEGLAAMRPVIALKPRGGARHAYVEELVAMACGEALAVLPLRAASPERLVSTLSSLAPPVADPRDLIAAAIAPILGLSAPVAPSPAPGPR